MRWEDESGRSIAEPAEGSGSVRYELRPRADAEPLSDDKPAWLDSDWEEVAVWRPWTDAEVGEMERARAIARAPELLAVLADAVGGVTAGAG